MAYVNPTVTKTYNILKAIMSSQNGMRVSEIAKTLEMAKSTVHGIVSALEELEAITKDPLTNRYFIGFSFFEFSEIARPYVKLVEHSRPILHNAMEETKEAVLLTIRRGRYHIILHRARPRSLLSLNVQVGMQIPLGSGAAGKSYLASLKNDQVMEYIKKEGLPKYTEYSITDPELYLKEVERTRKNGYATDDGEYVEGVRAVVCPIEGAKNLAPSIMVVGLSANIDNGKMENMIKAAVDASHAISQRLKLNG